jgi:MFS family permease
MTTEGVALYIVTAMNVSSITGRIVPVLFAQHLGPLNMIIGTILALTACGFGFLGASTIARVYVVAILYGFFSGTFFAVQPTVVARLTSDMSILGTRFGMAFTIMSVALLVGSPIGGALQGPGGYNASWAWVGATLFTGGLMIGTSRVLKAGWKPLLRV